MHKFIFYNFRKSSQSLNEFARNYDNHPTEVSLNSILRLTPNQIIRKEL